MKVKGIKLSEVIESLELLKRLCKIHKSCSTCWLYDPEEKETACLLVKAKEVSLAGNIEAALENIAQEHSCVMLECPYCPTCEHGFVSYPDYMITGEEGFLSDWHCLYDPAVEVKNEESKKSS